MTCDRCGAKDNFNVIDTRKSSDYGYRRRRECLSCGFRFTTYEIKPSDLMKQYETIVNSRVYAEPEKEN